MFFHNPATKKDCKNSLIHQYLYLNVYMLHSLQHDREEFSLSNRFEEDKVRRHLLMFVVLIQLKLPEIPIIPVPT